MEEELGGGGAPMVLLLGFLRGESERAKRTEDEGEREMSERDSLMAAQGRA
jgi:hypothetical protein